MYEWQVFQAEKKNREENITNGVLQGKIPKTKMHKLTRIKESVSSTLDGKGATSKHDCEISKQQNQSKDTTGFQRVKPCYLQKIKIKMALDFQRAAQRQWGNAFKILKEIYLQPRIPDPDQLSIRFEDRRKKFSG